MCTKYKVYIFLVFCLLLTGCGPEGLSFKKDIYVKNGLAYTKETDRLYSGKIYFEVCEECSEPFLNNWPVHYIGEYKEGKKHGNFYFPKSGRQDDFFEYRKYENQKKVIYSEGEIISGKNT